MGEVLPDQFISEIFAGIKGTPVVAQIRSAKAGKTGFARHYAWAPDFFAHLLPGAWYFCLSTTNTVEENGHARRRKPDLATTACIVIDDVGTKVDRRRVETLLPAPSWILISSMPNGTAGNYQWGFILAGGEEPAGAAKLLERLADIGLTDAGAKDAAHIFRLPGSLNEKYDPPFAARLEKWAPERRYSLAKLAANLPPEHDDRVVAWFERRGMVYQHRSDGGLDIACPWAAKHTAGAEGDTSTTYWPATGGRPPGFRCLHGHCDGRDVKALFEWIKATDSKFKFPRPSKPSPKDGTRPLSPDGSEDALALELVDRHGHELRYVARFGQWFRWDGRRWAEDETVAIYDLCRAIARVRAFIDEGTALGRKLASATTVSGIERLARSDRRVALIMGRLDADPAILNTPGGIVDLRTGAIGPSNPAALCSQITAVAPAPDHEDCPAWKAALDLYMKHDNEMVAYLQRFAGYCLWGALVDQVVVFAHGKGGNGKGTYFNTMLRIMGGYARNAPSEVFLTSTFDRHPTELARLHNARLVVASEIEKGRRWNMTRLNSMSGGDTVTARFMRQDDFEYAPKFKLALFANNKPNFGKVDEAVRRRLHLVAFDHVVTDRDRAADPGFDARIKAEWPAILRWAINGCLDWQREGLNPPQKVIDASAEYLANQNNVAAWLADGCVEDAGATATLRDLFASWSSWCEANGERPGSSRALAELLEEAGFSRVRIGKASTRSHASLRLATT